MKPKKGSAHMLIWKNPIFLLLSFANFFAEWGLFVPLTYLPDAAVVKDISPEDANYLISAFGIMNMIGTILFTSISDISWVEPFWVFATSLLLCGVTTFLAPFCYNFATFIALSLSFGLFASSLALTPIVTVNSLGLDNLSQAMGYMMVFRASSIVGPPIAGLLFEATLNYDWTFILAGIVYTIAAILVAIAAILQNRRLRKKSH